MGREQEEAAPGVDGAAEVGLTLEGHLGAELVGLEALEPEGVERDPAEVA